jgi:hypothetical protein
MKRQLEESFLFEAMQILCAGELDSRSVRDEGELMVGDYSRRNAQCWLTPAISVGCQDPDEEEP